MRSFNSSLQSGKRAIIYGKRANGSGHVFNAVNQNGKINFIDGQTGGAASLEGFESFKILRTN